jgi:K+-transporting ATPase KdpF subunit
MSFLYWVGGLACLVVFVYLIYALVRAEDF